MSRRLRKAKELKDEYEAKKAALEAKSATRWLRLRAAYRTYPIRRGESSGGWRRRKENRRPVHIAGK